MTNQGKNTIIDFEWDPRKATVNIRKHGVSFQEAATVFADPRQISVYDVEHSRAEDRWVTLGVSKNGRLLVVCHTFMDVQRGRVTIRVFSSRKATKTETREYTKLG